jgi:7,8-dihydropterin-6-yl-methyl-4-(beta-D-ribofuranosyl)aminobenzene 5'-phosphate synthase
VEVAKRVRITVLSDNFTSTIIPPLIGEWGFSAFIEADGVGVLYDVGNSGLPVVHNAEALGIDLRRDVDYVILSHGHSDHTGGLANQKLREALKGKVVIAHPNVFEKKFLSWRGRLDYIGIPLTKEEMEREFRLVLTREPLEFAKGVMFAGEVKSYGFPRYTKGLLKSSSEGVEQDELLDDVPLYVNTPKGLVIITGCGHSGILNIIRHAKEVTGVEKVYAVLGGFHLLSSPSEHVDEVMKVLEGEADLIGPAHCSGFRARLTRKFIDAGVGSVIDIA